MTIRIAVVLTAIVAVAMAYPWQSRADYWVLGVAAVVVLVALAWWRGLFATTIIARRLAILTRNGSTPGAPADSAVTVLVRVNDPAGVGLSLPLVAGYVDRYGVRADKVRVTSMDDRGARTTWISVTLRAEDNLAALAARSPELPLRDTAEIVGRRLTDHLRETGLAAAIVDNAPAPLCGRGSEKWRGVSDDSWACAYQIPVDDHLPERLADVWAQSMESWAALEFRGTAAHPAVVALCAFRNATPFRSPLVTGLISHHGIQRPLLTALSPLSVERAPVPDSPLTGVLLEHLAWPVGDALSSRT